MQDEEALGEYCEHRTPYKRTRIDESGRDLIRSTISKQLRQHEQEVLNNGSKRQRTMSFMDELAEGRDK